MKQVSQQWTKEQLEEITKSYDECTRAAELHGFKGFSKKSKPADSTKEKKD